ncbi:MAG: sigma-70 family RNA polymerase sigma factor [Pirellulaceae bacterium]|nr:sigma-70 family RNA polymerase sigma factor [Pirellulaceae bacterium]
MSSYSSDLEKGCLEGSAVQDDVDLVHNANSGDRDAFGMLVCRYQNRLFNTMYHIAGNREEAEDVVQEAFVQAFLKLDTFRQKSAFYTWLYRIAFNIFVNRKRRKKVQTSLETIRADSGQEPIQNGTASNPQEHLLQKERAVEVHRALQRLSQEHRSILVLREMENCCYDTISEILHLPVGTVRSRLHRARNHLRDELTPLL